MDLSPYTQEIYKYFATEMFKVYRSLLPNIVAEIFHAHQNNHNWRHSSFFFCTFLYRSESLCNLGPIIWNLVPSALKELDDVRHKLKNGNLKTVLHGYVKHIHLMLDSCSFFYPF